ncbi:unnamed protein product, partial [Symbiodinium necroappetens]
PLKARQIRQAQRAAEHHAAGQVTKPVFKALNRVWSTLPEEAKEAISKAGFEVKPSPPPGLPASGRQQRGGTGKGRVSFAVEGSGDSGQAETVKSLFASASDAQRELLAQLGFVEPEEQPIDLTALCKQHISSLPEDIRKFVEEPPERPPTPQEVMSEKSRLFKVATTDLRDIIFKKSALQLRLNKHKEQYASMLEDMQSINEKLDARQKEVSSLQLELQSSVNASPAPEALPDAAEALVKQVEAMEVDQIDEYRKRIVLAFDEAAKRRRTDAPDNKPAPPSPAPPEQGPGQQEASEGAKARSSPGHPEKGPCFAHTAFEAALPPDACEELWKQSRIRLKMWKHLKEVLDQHSCIPEEEEATLLALAELDEVKDNEDGLEGWTVYQLLTKVSECATSGFEILAQAVDDIIVGLSCRKSRTIRIRSSNLTQWRPETQKWMQSLSDDVILVQETHLTSKGVAEALAAMHKVGYEMLGGEAATSAKQGTNGGVSLLLLSLYLKNSTPIQCHPNAEILGRLTALLKGHVGQWIVAGDFNVSPNELADTNIVSELGGQILCAGEPTTHGGSELDFVITSSAVAGHTSLQLDWSAPHRPHASLCITLEMPCHQDKALRLPGFLVKDSVEDASLELNLPEVESLQVLGQDLSSDDISRRWAAISKWCQQAMYPDETEPRGGSLGLHRLPQVPGQPCKPYSTQAGLWLRVESWLNAVTKAKIKLSKKTISEVLEQLEFHAKEDSEADCCRAEILAHLLGSAVMSKENEEYVRGCVKQAQSEHLAEAKQTYQSWLEGAQVKGMRPLYKAIRSHEQVLVRPFRDKEAALRPYLRYYQWQEIWKSQPNPVDPVVPELLSRAVEEAASLPAITAAKLQTKFHCLPEKAPGVDGWNNRMLKQLPPGALEPLAQFLNHMEATGKAPGQWRVVKFAMLAKKSSIERPIGLCDVVYKAWLQVRYSLVQAWMKQYEQWAPWDAAKPGVTCLSVSIARIFKSEVAVATGRHRATLFLDLTTFYETLAHSRLIASAQELAFPASLLNIAIQIYRGARIIDAEGTMSPVCYTGCGVVAGCPVAPALSKLALYRPCRAVQNTGLLAGLDTWIDDVSMDTEDADPQRAAQKIVALYRTISVELDNAELLISASKSAFVCTDRHTQHRLRQLLLPDDPPVLHLVKDLGVDSAGARRRRVATSNARISKASCRSGKLTRLRIPNPKKRAQIAATGVETAATFGHQGQGISPKRMKVLRAIAGGHYGKLSFGSLDLIFDLSHVGSGVSRSPQRWTIATGPIGAMQCYLLDMGFEAPTMDIW